MLKIKLVRFGKRNQPHYRIVIQEARTKRDGKYTAKIGHYAPTQNPKILEINMEEYKKWIAKGAQPTETVASLAKRFASGNPFPEKKKKVSKKQAIKNKKAKEEAAKPVEEKPAEEEKVEEPVVEKADEPVEEKGVEDKKVEKETETKK
ncbi:MAG: 30S ribosomal protein S16 [Candidatus Pacebacteria bacterium]|jgi:small subunit ribosomal protein S16|nr:30S ribosomal protein S16 [Candidatus Paceibacterota bacterium]MBT3511922.1 30S ribosomal protein S16 [Candidatus Paceibacterota bacterium]MBT4005244.1 30S ribosomal protein S16 [Candidatus Paceibacterota bacterium]MBT4358964.1 30S ribosomal protein S16 [Candidatus Paceibacterota bacterium]MBT4680471.1 30S ribosomal protein S16 [Candidatus Paceibacterota bacterium]